MSNSLRSPAAAAPKSFEYDPYRMLSVQDGLYCLGKTSTHAEITMLAVDRVVSIRLTDTPFKVRRISTRNGTNARPLG
jgi:hypothetical protein